MAGITKDELNALIADIYAADAASITEQTRFTQDLDADSMKRTIFAAELEDLGIEISVAQLVYMETIGDLYKALGL